jgi:hypothetical protein
MSLSDLLQRTSAIYTVINTASKNLHNGGANPQTGTACNLTVYSNDFNDKVKGFEKKIHTVLNSLDADLNKQLAQLESTNNFNANLQKTVDSMKGYLTKQYGPSVAERATRLLHS